MMLARLTLALASALVALAGPPAAIGRAGRANAGLPSASPVNPIAGLTWGRYRITSPDPSNDAPSAYLLRARSTAHRAAFERLIAQPRFRWFGAWNPIQDEWGGRRPGARNVVRRYIRTVTGGRPDVGVQVAVFRLDPFEAKACRLLPSRRQRTDYKRWIEEFAAGIGQTRTVLVLQPDMPFTLCLPGGSSLDLDLIRWAARRFAALPHTTVYIDAGAADWSSPARMASMLRRAGVGFARGFALNITHYDSTAREIAYGRKILRALATRGVRGRHFVVNTAQNGRPFANRGRDRRTFRLGLICARPSARRCVTLGRPPTTATGSRAVDAFLWIGRPWLANTRVRSYDETLRLVRTSPF